MSEESEIAGQAAAEYINNKNKEEINLKIEPDGKVRYTVPQIVTRKKDFEIFFRVSNIYKDCEIILKDAKNEMIKLKKQKLVPGEMEKIKVKKEMLENIEGDTLYISLK